MNDKKNKSKDNENILYNNMINYMNNCKKMNIDTVSEKFFKIHIDIAENNNSVVKMKYGIIYHAMSYCAEIQLIFKNNLLFFVKYDLINDNTFDTTIPKSLNIDFSYKNILREYDKTKKISGSESVNNTYLYCHDLITVNILSSIYNIDSTVNNIQIIFPTVSSSVIFELIYIFGYLCKDIYLKKNGDWLKDSFIMCACDIDKIKLKTIKKEISDNINYTEQNRIKKINELIDNFNDTSFFNNISKFVIHIESVCSAFWNIIIDNYTRDSINRSSERWSVYDKLIKYKIN